MTIRALPLLFVIFVVLFLMLYCMINDDKELGHCETVCYPNLVSRWSSTLCVCDRTREIRK
jgi:hypothetical protein